MPPLLLKLIVGRIAARAQAGFIDPQGGRAGYLS
jgi:hypothetical protein